MSELDVIIPCRAPAPWLTQAVESCLESSVDSAVWVVDDGSIDASVTETVAAIGDARVRYLRQAASGPSAARNTGLRAGCAPWLLYLDADDFLLPGAMASMLAAAQVNGGVVLAGWRDVSADGSSILAEHRPPPASNLGALADLIRISPPLGPVLLPRTPIVWDESRRVWEVTRYFNRVAAEIEVLTVLPDCMAALRQHDSVTRLSHSQRHFAIDVQSTFWQEEYAWLRSIGESGDPARYLVAERLLGLAYAGLRSDDPSAHAAASSTLALAGRERWQAELRCRIGAAAWIATRLGATALRAFARLNLALGR